METIYLIICETEYINESNGTVMERFTSIYGANKTIEKAEEDKTWYEEKDQEMNTNKYIRRRFFIQTTILE